MGDKPPTGFEILINVCLNFIFKLPGFVTLYNYNVYNVLIKSTGHTINGQINVWVRW